MAETYFCSRCNKTMDESNFYTYKDGTKTELCKKCLTAHIDNFNPDTFLWLLEKMNVPYIPEEWNVLRDRAYAKDPNKMNGMSVFGKYLSKMKLKQWKQFGWADTETLKHLNEDKRIAAAGERALLEASLKDQLDNGQITEAQYKTLVSTETQNKEALEMGVPPPPFLDPNNPFNETQFISEDELPDPAAELTQEDKIYLAMKWGRTYRPSEWVELEKNYTEMMNSFDIQDADTMNTLIVLCKTSLKMNQAIDSGDLDGFQKLSKVYESLRKSAKFTAAQNKAEKGEFIDSVGQLVAYCEKEGGQIPKYKIETNLDIVDKVVKDLKDYTKSLIYEDTALSQQIEDYIKRKEISESMKKDRQEAIDKGLEAVQIEEKDIQEHYERIEIEKKKDIKTISGEQVT